MICVYKKTDADNEKDTSFRLSLFFTSTRAYVVNTWLQRVEYDSILGKKSRDKLVCLTLVYDRLLYVTCFIAPTASVVQRVRSRIATRSRLAVSVKSLKVNFSRYKSCLI